MGSWSTDHTLRSIVFLQLGQFSGLIILNPCGMVVLGRALRTMVCRQYPVFEDGPLQHELYLLFCCAVATPVNLDSEMLWEVVCALGNLYTILLG